MEDQDTESTDEHDEVKTYECENCGYRTEAEHLPGECPRCGGEMIDISVPRE